MEHMSSGAVIKASMPDWLLRLDLTRRLRDIRVASDELKVRRFGNLARIRSAYRGGRDTCRT